MTAAIPDADSLKRIRDILGHYQAIELARKPKRDGKTDQEIQANVTLAMLRVQGTLEFVSDDGLRDVLGMAGACLEYVHGALEARRLRELADSKVAA